MPGKYAKRKKFPLIPLLVAAAVIIALIAAAIFLLPGSKPTDTPPQTTQSTTVATEATTVPPTTVPPTTAPTEPDPMIEASATLTVTGDLLMHKPVFQSCWDAEAGDWIFDSIFTYVKPYIEKADYAVANLETTLCGPDNGYAYSGNPLFNCPDGIALSARDTGFDMLLTGNNHCYDTRMVGIRRTLNVVEELGLATLGTQRYKEDPDYTVVEVNGIKIGMTTYTFETHDGMPTVPSINAIQCHPSSIGMINSFDYGQLEKFYEEIGAQFDGMREQGAEAIVVYIHWGEEYELAPNDLQVKIAQQLCDMGVDVIVGGHPHVIQPADLLTSTLDESHKTLIIYSTGNAVSNQRIHEMRLKTGHTEDGILFNFTFVRYVDGSVALRSTDCVPTWVHMEGIQESYTILPLDYSQKDNWPELFQIDEEIVNNCTASYFRTMDLVEPGLTKAQQYLDEANAAKLEALRNPPPPTEAPTEAPTEVPTEVPSETTEGAPEDATDAAQTATEVPSQPTEPAPTE